MRCVGSGAKGSASTRARSGKIARAGDLERFTTEMFARSPLRRAIPSTILYKMECVSSATKAAPPNTATAINRLRVSPQNPCTRTLLYQGGPWAWQRTITKELGARRCSELDSGNASKVARDASKKRAG